ncbi:MAG TPA: SGNH/GDSL hydrolase family protein [Candidatus Binatia bacterium]|nr:SGNH/GDSL hydrolase family protein [Candidatus Binatia bacterium]
MLRALGWWLGGAALLPLLLVQGRRARRNTPRLPEARGERAGAAGQGAALHLLVIGESPVAGVGVDRFEEALAPQLAAALAATLGRRVQWQALGENGADAGGVLERLVPRIDGVADVAVLAVGVNDTTRFTSLARWQRTLRALVAALRMRCHGAIVVAGVPPMAQFRALPQPLRSWLGLRSRLLDAAAREALSGMTAVRHAPTPRLAALHLARDGYHPSPAGAAAWAAMLAAEIARAVELPAR